MAEQHAAAVALDEQRAAVIAAELKLDDVLAAGCGNVTALIPTATHLPEAGDWVAEWVAGDPIDRCMAAIDEKAKALQSPQSRQARDAYDFIIDVYNEKFPLLGQLASYGYQETAPGRWRSPNQASNSPAVVVLPDGDRWCSFSGSDMAAAVGGAARSGVRWGDSFSLMKHYECGRQHYKALRLAAQRCGLTPPPRRGLPRLATAPPRSPTLHGSRWS